MTLSRKMIRTIKPKVNALTVRTVIKSKRKRMILTIRSSGPETAKSRILLKNGLMKTAGAMTKCLSRSGRKYLSRYSPSLKISIRMQAMRTDTL